MTRDSDEPGPPIAQGGRPDGREKAIETATGQEKRYGIVANVVTDGVFRCGAKVWILVRSGDPDRVRCEGLSKSGRRVSKWISQSHLENHRAAWCPPHVPSIMLGDKAWAEKIAECWGFVYGQAQARDDSGKVIREGQSAGELWKRWLETNPVPPP